MSFVQEHTNDDVHDYRDVGGRAAQEQLPRSTQTMMYTTTGM